jgi:hypothetical protein
VLDRVLARMQGQAEDMALINSTTQDYMLEDAVANNTEDFVSERRAQAMAEDAAASKSTRGANACPPPPACALAAQQMEVVANIHLSYRS